MKSLNTPGSDTQKWLKISAICAFNFCVTWFLLGRIDPDLRHRLSTMEVFTLVITPAILFYLRNDWTVWRWSASLIDIAIVTVFTYSFLHEGSHVLGVYAIGSRPTEVHLIPKYWQGEFTTGASVASEPVNGWIGAIPGLAPYVKDVVFVLIGIWILKWTKTKSAFLAGIVYVTVCLASLFDIVNNYSIMLVLGKIPGNDFAGTAERWGALWTHAIGITFSAVAFAACAYVLVFYAHRPSRSAAGYQ